MFDRRIFGLPGAAVQAAIFVVLSAVQAGCIVAMAVMLARFVVGVWSGDAFAAEVPNLVAACMCFFARRLVGCASDFLAERFADAAVSRMFEDYTSALYSQGVTALDKRMANAKVGEGEVAAFGDCRGGATGVVQDVSRGFFQVRTYLASTFPKTISLVVQPLCICVAIALQDWLSAIICAVCFPFIIAFMRLIGHTASDDSARRLAKFKAMGSHFLDAVAGMPTLISYGRAKKYERAVRAASESFRRASERTIRIASLSSAVLDLFATCALAGVAIMLGFRLAEGEVAFLPALATLVLVPEFFLPVRTYAADYHAGLDGKSAWTHIEGLLLDAPEQSTRRVSSTPVAWGGAAGVPSEAAQPSSTPTGTPEATVLESSQSMSFCAEHYKPCNAGCCNTRSEAQGVATAGALRPGAVCNVSEVAESTCGLEVGGKPLLSFDHVSFSYGDAPVLKDVTFTLHQGDFLLICGTSGAGKSTLLDLLGAQRLPDSGQIIYTSDNSTADSWRARIAYIPQHPYVFAGTVAQNVAFYNPGATPAQVDAALNAVGLAPLVADLPQKEHTLIGEGGRALSGGEAHRLALARAICAPERDVWVLDEPTAHLDEATELELKQAFLRAASGKTVIMATHRAHWESQATAIIRLSGCACLLEIAESTCRPASAPAGAAAAGAGTSARASAAEFSDNKIVSENCLAKAFAFKPHACVSSSYPSGAATYEATASGSTDAVFDTRPGWLAQLLRKHIGLALLCILLGVVGAVFSAALMFTSGFMISAAACIPATVLVLHLPSIFVRIFGVGRPCIGYIERNASHSWVLRATTDLRVRLYRAVERSSGIFGGRMQTARALKLMSDSIEDVQNIVLRGVFPIAVNVITFVLGAILCIMLSWELFIVYIICIGLVVLVFPPLQVALSRRSTRNLRNAQTALYSRAADCVQGLVDWRLSGRVSDFSQRLREPFEAALASLRHSSRINRVISIASQALFAIFVAVIAWWATCAFAPNVVEGGAHTVWSATAFARGIATTSDSQGFAYAANWITAFVLAAFPLFEHFASTAPAAADLDFRHPSLKDLREIETFQPSALVGVTESTCRSQATPTGAAAITMDSVTFTFPNSTRSVFNNLSLTIAPGAHVAVVGRSGVGKTTLVRLIAGELVPCRGSVRVANCNPHIARNVAVVEQVPHIFNTTLRENLLVANGRATDTQIEDALRAVGLESLLERSGGLASLLVLDGANVSGGQRQRIALARALVSAAPVVVLDEPFAAIDPDLELRLLDTIKHAFKGRTLICVTHHTDNLAFFDQVIELHS